MYRREQTWEGLNRKVPWWPDWFSKGELEMYTPDMTLSWSLQGVYNAINIHPWTEIESVRKEQGLRARHLHNEGKKVKVK